MSTCRARSAAVSSGAVKVCIMDRYTPSQVARRLGVSRRRLTSAAARDGIGVVTNGRRLFVDSDVSRLRDRLGTSPMGTSLSRSEAVVLAELSRRPRGLVSARAVARACGLSPTTAAKAIRSLVAAGLVIERDAVIALGRARRVRSLHPNVRHPQWSALLPLLRQVSAPATSQLSASVPIPAHVRHAFWNVDDVTLAGITPAEDGPFIASRALATEDPDLLAFAVATVPRSAWTSAGRSRGLTDEQRAFASNLAREDP